MAMDITDNPGASSSGEPLTVGAGAVTTSAMPTAVQASLATTAKSTSPAVVGRCVSTGDNTTTLYAWPPGWVRPSPLSVVQQPLHVLPTLPQLGLTREVSVGAVFTAPYAAPVVLGEDNDASSGEDDDAENPWTGLS